MEQEKASTPNLLQDISSINFTDSLCSIIVKLPSQKEALIPDNIKDNLSFREYTSLLNGIGLKAPRTRTKLDMINSIISFIGDFWPSIHQIATERVRGIIQKDESQSKSSKNKQFNINKSYINKSAPVARTPYDSYLANIISNLYLESPTNYSDVLITSTEKESKKFTSIFNGINPAEQHIIDSPTSNDNLIIQFFIGIDNRVNAELIKFNQNIEQVNSMIDLFTQK